MSKNYQRFGKYLILDHLVDGGMAKICRANYLGEQANKIVAIKMIQPQYSKNPSFVQMFEDELKVTFGLLHPNIAQVYDYGMVDDQLYSAMEYVDGANLKQFLDRLKEKKFVFPVEISTYIVSQVAQALHYAHTFQDKLTGKSFNIIHRDISPHNIMITYDGAVKVIDFGIAKADSNSEATQAGTIKGKLSYLAPEYLEGLELDHRYDQFAVGITLWEMLCSRKLFSAKNDLAVLKLIQACNVPKPSSINPNVPAELDEIVLKALSKDRSNRFENLDKLNRALVKFLYSNFPEFNATDLSYFAKQLFKDEIQSDKEKFVEFGKIDIKPYLEDLQRSESGDTRKNEKAEDGSFLSDELRSGKIELDLGSFDAKTEGSTPNLDLNFSDSTATGYKIEKLQKDTVTKKSNLKGRVGAAANANGKASPASGTRVNRTKIANKNSLNKKQEKKNGGFGLIGSALVAGSLMVGVLKPDLVKDYTGIDLGKVFGVKRDLASNPSLQVEEKENEPKIVEKGRIVFDNLDSNMTIKLNGKNVEMDAFGIYVEKNVSYVLEVEKPGYKTWKYDRTINLSGERPKLEIIIPELERLSIGFLTTSQNFSPGSVIYMNINGEKIKQDLPLRNYRIPAGSYEATISNKVLGIERKVKFTIKENKRNFLK